MSLVSLDSDKSNVDMDESEAWMDSLVNILEEGQK